MAIYIFRTYAVLEKVLIYEMAAIYSKLLVLKSSQIGKPFLQGDDFENHEDEKPSYTFP